MLERGAIRTADHRQQLADFTKLRWGQITPTDIDGFIDFSNKLFVFFEGKHGGACVPYGQELALERLCDACHNTDRGRYAVAFVVNHQTPSPHRIDYSSAMVAKYRWNGNWHVPRSNGLHLLEGIEQIRRKLFPVDMSEHAEWIAAYTAEDERLSKLSEASR